MDDPQPVDPYAGRPAPDPAYSPPPGWGAPYPPAQPGAYPGGAYPAPSYAAPSYAPPAYPPAYGTPPYGPPFAAAYTGGYPPPPPLVGYRPARPGVVFSAAVLSFVAAGLLVISSLVLLAGSSVTASLSEVSGQRPSWVLEYSLDAVVDLVCAGLLVAGGVLVATRRAVGRYLVSAGAVIVLGAAVYWIGRFDLGGALVSVAVAFALLVLTAAALVWLPESTTWLTTPATAASPTSLAPPPSPR